MKKTLIGLLAGLLTLSAFSCDSPLTSVKEGTSIKTNDERAYTREAYLHINPKDSELSRFRVKEALKLVVTRDQEDHNNDVWHLETYAHTDAKHFWDKITDYAFKNLGEDKASTDYWFDKRSGLHYDHYHWYLVVNDTRIAEYEKVGGAASAAYDHVRLLKSWWDYEYEK